MKRRSFLAGLLGTTAMAALPIPKVEAVEEFVHITSNRVIAFPPASPIIGIALQSAGPGELVDILLSGSGARMKSVVAKQVYAGGMLTTEDTSLWVGKTPEQILEDISHARTVLSDAVMVYDVPTLTLDIETRHEDD